MYENVYSSTTVTTIAVLFALAGVCIATWAVLSIHWNLREIGRGRARAKTANGRDRS